jgi:hypothetical protein
MKKTLVVCMAILMFAFLVIGTANAATEAQKQAAIASGLAYLATQQQGDGSFPGALGYPIAATASALLAFEEQYYKQGNTWGTLNGGLGYGTVVTNAANYLLNNVTTTNISAANWWGFSGTYADKIGAYWGGYTGEEAYQTGLALPAIARLTNGINGITPGTTIGTGPLAGQTYLNVIQRTVDQITWSQAGGVSVGVYAGGWHYLVSSAQTDADNSTAQWPVIGLTFAKGVPGVTVYPQTAAELQKWINYIQNPVDGSSGYDGPFNSYNNEAKTGGLLVEMVYAGGGGNMALAKAYLNANWKNTANGTWFGNFGQPYAMWSIYKGLEETIGLDDMTTITNLNVDPGDVNNPNHGWNWWEDYCNSLVLSQNGSGSWNGYDYWDAGLATPWNINILNATAIGPPPVTTPEPGSLLLVLGGLFGLGFVRRSFKG